MTEQTEAERNEAIEEFEKKLKSVKRRIAKARENQCPVGGWYTKPMERDEKIYTTAISALKQQSEAERRIEKIMEWCLSDKETESTRENIATERAQCEILEILEGKAE